MPNPSREAKISGTNVDREILIFPVQLSTSRVGNLTRLIHTFAICVTVHTCTTAGTSNMPTSYQKWVWEREAHTN